MISWRPEHFPELLRSKWRLSKALVLSTPAKKTCRRKPRCLGVAVSADVAYILFSLENAQAALQYLRPLTRNETVQPMLFSGDALPM
jgi:hypothetical protein